ELEPRSAAAACRWLLAALHVLCFHLGHRPPPGFIKGGYGLAPHALLEQANRSLFYFVTMKREATLDGAFLMNPDLARSGKILDQVLTSRGVILRSPAGIPERSSTWPTTAS